MATGTIALAGVVAGGIAGYQQKKQAEREADIAVSEAEQKAELIEKEAERVKGTQKSRYLASGLDLSGSPLLLMEDTLARGRKQAGDVREMGMRTARAMKRRGRRQFISSLLGGASSGLQTSSSFRR